MAYDKVVDSAALDAAMTYTAGRIRAKTGSTDQIAWDSAKGFGDAVDAIPTGGDPLEAFENLRKFELCSNSTLTEFVANLPNVTSLSYSFSSIRTVPLQKIELTVSSKLTNISSMFGNTVVNTLTEIVFKGDFSKVTTLHEAFSCGGTGQNQVLKKIAGLDFTSVTNAGSFIASQVGLTDLDIKANTVNIALGLNNQPNLNLASCINVLNALKDRTGQDALTLTLNAALKTADTGMIYANYVKLDADSNLYVPCESTDTGAVTIAAAITAKNWTIA